MQDIFERLKRLIFFKTNSVNAVNFVFKNICISLLRNLNLNQNSCNNEKFFISCTKCTYAYKLYKRCN